VVKRFSLSLSHPFAKLLEKRMKRGILVEDRMKKGEDK
jgi:hypothetical protein